MLLHRLIEEGDRVLADTDDEVQAGHRAAVAAMSGAFPGLYPEGYLEELRGDWPT